MKQCKVCFELKEVKDFYAHSFYCDGVSLSCKECQKKNARENRSKEKDKARYKKNPKKRLQVIFLWMKKRCEDPNNPRWSRYGERWIIVEWKSFIDFYNDMQQEYIQHYNDHLDKKRNTQIDRIDNNWNYCKSNCRFVTAKENARNSSRYKAQL